MANQTCVSEYAAGGENICLDLFIMAERAAFLVGDNRDHDPGVPFKASRAQIYINPVICSVTWVVSPTRTVTFGPFGGGEHAPHKLNRVEPHWSPSGECVVEWQLLNGFCQTYNITSILCPAINGMLVLRRDGNGGWVGNINEDKFPSRGLYKLNGTRWDVVSERSETIWLDLASKRRHIERIRIARDEAMPPGCMLQ